MAKTESVQSGGITFGDWKLKPVDKFNWELCHRHQSGSDSPPKWYPQGRFYQYDTFENALIFAADAELKEKRKDRAANIMRALDEYRAIVDALRADMAEALRGLS